MSFTIETSVYNSSDLEYTYTIYYNFMHLEISMKNLSLIAVSTNKNIKTTCFDMVNTINICVATLRIQNQFLCKKKKKYIQHSLQINQQPV